MFCSIAHCKRSVYARGWCRFHYMRWHRNGDPNLALRPWGRGRRDVAARFWAKVEKSDGCWLWTGFAHHTGYGYFKFGQESVGAHRVSWTLAYGPIPEGKRVCHHCDIPLCVRPAHLFLGSDADNAHDRDRKGRNINHRGLLNGRAKLSPEIAIEIRRLSSDGWGQRRIALHFGVAKSTIGTVLSGKTWRT